MPRRRIVEKREILPDPKYKSIIVAHLVNSIMRNGKKSLALKTVYSAFEQVAQKLESHFAQENIDQDSSKKTDNHSEQNKQSVEYANIPLVVFKKALENVQPWVEVRSTRVGGGTYRVPTPAIRPNRRRALGLSFLRKAALKRKANTTFQPGDRAMAKLLALEILDAYENKGAAVKMCIDMHRSAKANQAYVQVQFQSPQELKL